MPYTNEERILILGSLFHDIGKFEQRCTSNPQKKYHQELGKELILSGRFQHRFEKIVGKEYINHLAEVIQNHHQKDPSDNLTRIIKEADRLSASERVDKEEVEVYQDQWKYKHLTSLFSKIKILSDEAITPIYYKHKLLTKKDYDVIIPTETAESDLKAFSFKEADFNLFLEDLEYVLDIYECDEDFDSLINLLLIIFEKYLWCIPDFTGNPETDISLFNHLKDVAGFAHAIYLTHKINSQSTNLNLVIGDIPGIQSYIFDVVHKKPAKVLRGRSIFVQVLTRNLATKLLKTFGLSEVNLIMLAGGKFYIIAQDTEESKKEKFVRFINDIDDYLFDNFRMQLSFNCACHTFNYQDLMDKNNPLTFGKIVEDASHALIENRYQLFNKRLFNKEGINYKNYIWEEDYIDDDGTGSDSIKCQITDKPISRGRKRIIAVPDGDITVDLQVKNEYKIGSQITGNNIIAVLNDDNLTIDPENIKSIGKFKDGANSNKTKLLLNPTLDDLLKKENLGKDIFKNTHYIEVANYCSRNESDEIMPFEDMAEQNVGAKFLTLIKGDIDNLGLIMAYGLDRDKKTRNDGDDEKDLTGISRTTTLSNHLKYFFSFFLNGFLMDWEKKKQEEIKKAAKENNSQIKEEKLKELKNENRVYTIFAGGDDLMLVTPQSSAIKLIKAFNEEFQKLTCDNNEVHISYSITHFKDHTPIKIVADFAEENQNEGKKFTKDEQQGLLKTKDKNSFFAANDKAGTFLFDTFVKNKELDYLIRQIDTLTIKAKDEKSGLSRGLIRRLLDLSETLKKYEETEDATYLIAYARLNHTVNRLLKDKDKDIIKFFENVLTINKKGNNEAQKLEKILYPLVCQVIYNIRK